MFAEARGFIEREARLLEQRLFATLFDGVPPQGVVDALRGYQNLDGGFGHGLEPDKRCPASLPIDVVIAFQALVAVDAVDEELVRRACDYLASVADPNGAVSLAFPVIESYPRAEHWSEWTYVPGVFPTAGLAGLLHRMGVDHPWLADATRYCWSSLEAGMPDDAHALLDATIFLEHVPDQGRAATLVPALRESLATASSLRHDPSSPEYGVTPLHFAPNPESRWRQLFPDDVVDAHLDRLARDQQPDGGWPLSWKPPNAAATLEWRGIETLRALRTLGAYGR
jgi:hypothetical protein